MKNEWNREIVKNRDPKWVEKMVQGKLDHQLKPSKLRYARMMKKKSQEEVASLNDLSHTTYGDIERGRRPVRSELASRIAESVGKRVQDLFEKVGKKFLARR